MNLIRKEINTSTQAHTITCLHNGTIKALSLHSYYHRHHCHHHLPITYCWKDVVDQHLSPPTDEFAGEVISVMKLAFECLSSSPQYQPTMQQVSKKLSTKNPPLSKPFLSVTLGQLFNLQC
ncbi:hypothetical protein ACSBR1_030114 [Camellia fascicularis]